MVVFSLSTTTLLARPRSFRSRLSSLMPRSSLMNLPPVRMAMSSHMALRRRHRHPHGRQDVFAHGLAAITEARRFDSADVQRAAELVDDEGGEGFAFDVFSNDQQRLADLGDLLENRKQVFQ